MIEDLRKLLNLINEAETIFASDADWQFKYDLIFTLAAENIIPALSQCGIAFDWVDPDASYEDDVKAFMDELSKMKENVQAVLENCRATWISG